MNTLEQQLTELKPRFVDVWVIPPALIYLAISQKGMSKWPRRLMFSAGLYMLLRNYSNYKSAAQATVAIAKSADPLTSAKAATIDKVLSQVAVPVNQEGVG